MVPCRLRVSTLWHTDLRTSRLPGAHYFFHLLCDAPMLGQAMQEHSYRTELIEQVSSGPVCWYRVNTALQKSQSALSWFI
jgi:hypothetical protein